MFQIADRNARLAYDNSMLKLELNLLRKRVAVKNTKESKLQCITDTSMVDNTSVYRTKEQGSSNSVKKFNPLKSSLSEKSGLSINSQGKSTKSELAIRTSVTSLVERNKRHVLLQNQLSDKRMQFSKFNVERWDCLSEKSGPARTESAPELYTGDNQI